MGFDSVSLSTRTGLGSIYTQWKWAVSNKKTTDNFKTYLLSSQEHLNKLEGLFTDYGHTNGSCGDTFVRESIVELKDGRLLCMDPNEAKAYILDLNNVNSSSEKYNLTVIKPEDESASFAEQLTNVMSKISTQLGADGITTTKDGTKIDSNLLSGLLSGDTKTQYCDEMGVVDTSSTDNTYTSGQLKLIAGKGITDITTDSNEFDYYRQAFKAQGIEIKDNNTIFEKGSTTFISKLNNTINNLSKIINKGTTATDQDKLNALQIVRKMSTFEYELLEKMNPGFTQAFNTFIGDFQSRTYLDRNGNQTGADETISYQTVMQEKLNNFDYARSYLSADDRAIIDKTYIGKYVDDNGKVFDANNNNNSYTLITKNNLDNYIDTIKNYNKTPEQEKKFKLSDDLQNRYESAKKAATKFRSSSKAFSAMRQAIEQTVTLGVSNYQIEKDIAAIGNIEDSKPDEILLKFLEISQDSKNGAERIAKVLEDQTMVDKLKTACAKKGTLNIYRNGKVQTGELYNSQGQLDTRNYNVTNILNHLEYLTKSYYATKSDSVSAMNSTSATNTVDDAIYNASTGTEKGTNVQQSNVATTAQTIGYAATGVAGVGTAGIAAAAAAKAAAAKAAAEKAAAEIVKGAAAKAAKGAAIEVFKVGGIVTATIGGAALGLQIGNSIVNHNQDKYIKPDGTFNKTKAAWVKGLTSISGACLGGGLASIPTATWWSLIPLAVGGITALAAWAVHEWA